MIILILLVAAQVVSFVYLYNKLKKTVQQIKPSTIVVNSDFEKIEKVSSFSQNTFHRIYGDK